MALINCPECGTKVSSLAAACPQCAAPIAARRSARSVGQPVTTVAHRSKKLKLHLVLSIALLCVGFALFATFGYGPVAVIGLIVCLAGIFWLLATRIREWWHHT